MHDLVSRDIRQFIRENGRYRFVKLYELIQKNESLDNISERLEIDHKSILHWKTIFEMIGSDGFPSFVPDLSTTQKPSKLRLIVNEEPKNSRQNRENLKDLFKIY